MVGNGGSELRTGGSILTGRDGSARSAVNPLVPTILSSRRGRSIPPSACGVQGSPTASATTPPLGRISMSYARHALALVLAVWAPPLLAQADLPIRDTTLANGLQVIVIENHAVPLVTVELDVKNGGY